VPVPDAPMRWIRVVIIPFCLDFEAVSGSNWIQIQLVVRGFRLNVHAIFG